MDLLIRIISQIMFYFKIEVIHIRVFIFNAEQRLIIFNTCFSDNCNGSKIPPMMSNITSVELLYRLLLLELLVCCFLERQTKLCLSSLNSCWWPMDLGNLTYKSVSLLYVSSASTHSPSSNINIVTFLNTKRQFQTPCS